jgi:hypothetical protein
MERLQARSTTAHEVLAAAILLAACSGGCLSTLFGSSRDAAPSLCSVMDPETRCTLTFRASSAPVAGSPLMDGFVDGLERIGRERGGAAQPGPLQEWVDAALHPDAAGLVPAGGGLAAEDSDRALRDDARREMMRIVRKALSGAIRQQETYRAVRQALQLSVGGQPITRIGPAPVLEDPLRDDSHGASRLFPGAAGAALFRPLDPADMESRISVGMNPRVGFVWMDVYRFSYEPLDNEMVHRLEYTVGDIGIGAAYRIVDRAATDVGIGMQIPLGRLSVFTLSASRALHGADATPEAGPGAQQVLAELAWRF